MYHCDRFSYKADVIAGGCERLFGDEPSPPFQMCPRLSSGYTGLLRMIQAASQPIPCGPIISAQKHLLFSLATHNKSLSRTFPKLMGDPCHLRLCV